MLKNIFKRLSRIPQIYPHLTVTLIKRDSKIQAISLQIRPYLSQLIMPFHKLMMSKKISVKFNGQSTCNKVCSPLLMESQGTSISGEDSRPTKSWQALRLSGSERIRTRDLQVEASRIWPFNHMNSNLGFTCGGCNDCDQTYVFSLDSNLYTLPIVN